MHNLLYRTQFVFLSARHKTTHNLTHDLSLKPLCVPWQAYGEIRSLYTACKPRGFVVLSFYDLRASCLAIHALQGARVGSGNLLISFSTPKDNMGDKDAHQGRCFFFALSCIRTAMHSVHFVVLDAMLTAKHHYCGLH